MRVSLESPQVSRYTKSNSFRTHCLFFVYYNWAFFYQPRDGGSIWRHSHPQQPSDLLITFKFDGVWSYLFQSAILLEESKGHLKHFQLCSTARRHQRTETYPIPETALGLQKKHSEQSSRHGGSTEMWVTVAPLERKEMSKYFEGWHGDDNECRLSLTARDIPT